MELFTTLDLQIVTFSTAIKFQSLGASLIEIILITPSFLIQTLSIDTRCRQ